MVENNTIVLETWTVLNATRDYYFSTNILKCNANWIIFKYAMSISSKLTWSEKMSDLKVFLEVTFKNKGEPSFVKFRNEQLNNIIYYCYVEN